MQILSFSGFLFEGDGPAKPNLFFDELTRVFDRLRLVRSDQATPRQQRNGTHVLHLPVVSLAQLLLDGGFSGRSVSSKVNSRAARVVGKPEMELLLQGKSPQRLTPEVYYIYRNSVRKGVLSPWSREWQPSSAVFIKWDPDSPESSSQAVAEFVLRASSDVDHHLRLLRGKMASDPGASPETLLRLSRDSDEWVRTAVAQNPAAPAAVLADLAKREDSGIRFYVAKNPSTPVEVRMELARDRDQSVSRVAIDQLPEEKRAKVLRLRELGLL